MRPQTQFAKSGDAHIAYQVFGAGDLDLLVVHGLLSHLDLFWDWPLYARFMERLGSFARVITFDKRGVGLSDRVADLPSLTERMDDVRAVLDAAGSERAAVFGVSEGAPMSLLFAATHPERVPALVLYGGMARTLEDDDYPWGPPLDAVQESMGQLVQPHWGGEVLIQMFAPSLDGDPVEAEGWTRRTLAAASPGTMDTLWAMAAQVDVRHVLPVISSPTLVIHRKGDRVASVQGARWMAEQIPGAQYVELSGGDHFPWISDQETVLGEVEQFLTGVRGVTVPDRVLLTVLFTDIVGSTDRAVELGDEAWRRLLDQHHELVRRYLERFQGREVDTAGDGFFATFDGPARAVRCAQALTDAVRALGLEIRAGLHIGEVELREDGVSGLAVHVGARVAALAQPGEVLVSRTVKDLVAGSGITLADRGVHALKGVPDEWQLYAATTG